MEVRNDQQVRVVPNQIIQGDCVSVMGSMPAESVDFILTDPPYLVNYVSRDGRSYPGDTDNRWLHPAMNQMYRVLKDNSSAVCFCGGLHQEEFLRAWRRAGFHIEGELVFVKQYASSTRGAVDYRHESAFLLSKGHPLRPQYRIPDVIPFPYTGNELHPAQKPVEIFKPLILAFSRPGDLVLDAFAGSAGTCVASRELGRNYLGIELDPHYAQIARDRLASCEGKSHHDRVVPFRQVSPDLPRRRAANYSPEPTRSRGGGYAPGSVYGG